MNVAKLQQNHRFLKFHKEINANLMILNILCLVFN